MSHGIAWLDRGIGVIRVPVPLPVKATNAYILGDPPEAVVDCGPRHPASLGVIKAALADLRPPRVTIVTHLHVDHCGAAGTIQRESRCEVWMGGIDAEDGREFFAESRGDDRRYWERFVLNGMPREGARATQQAVDALRNLMEYPVVDRCLSHDEEITLGGRRWRVFVTPGHTAGHVCLFSREDGVLLSGDHVLPRITPNIGLSAREGFNPIAEYVRSLEATAGLGARVAYPGHGPVIGDPSARAREIIRHHVHRARQIMKILGDDALTGYQVTRVLWGDGLDSFQVRFAVAEAVAHLDWLASEGWVRKEVQDGVYIYFAIRTRDLFDMSLRTGRGPGGEGGGAA